MSTYVGGSSFLQNAPASEIYGAEAHFQGRFAEHFTLDIGGAYTHGRYTDFPNAALQIFCFTICTVPGTGVNGVPARTGLGVVNGTTNLAGGKMQRTPTWSGNIDLGYSNELAGGTVNLHGNFSYRSATAFDFSRTLVQPGYGLLNLNASWTDPSDKWTFSAIGRNVTGKRYLIQVLPNSGGFGAVHGEPMTWALQVGYKFN